MRKPLFPSDKKAQRALCDEIFEISAAKGLPTERLKALLRAGAIRRPITEVTRRFLEAIQKHAEIMKGEVERQIEIHQRLHQKVDAINQQLNPNGSKRRKIKIDCDPLVGCIWGDPESRWGLTFRLHAQFCQAFEADHAKYERYLTAHRTVHRSGALIDAMRAAVRKLPEGVEPMRLSGVMAYLKKSIGLSWRQIGFLRVANECSWTLPVAEQPWRAAAIAAKKASSQADHPRRRNAKGIRAKRESDRTPISFRR